MAAQQPGFLQSLGLTTEDERDIVNSQRAQAGTRQRQDAINRGKQLGIGLAGLTRGVVGAAKDKSFKNFGRNMSQGSREASDFDTAQSLGLTVEQVAGRREIRRLTGIKTGNEGSYGARIALTKKIAAIANRSGDTEVLAGALRKIDDLRREQTEFRKLQAITGRAETEELESGVMELMLNDEPVTGTVAEDEDGNRGAMLERNGQMIFKRFGDELKLNDGGLEHPNDLLKRYIPTKALNEIRGKVVLASEHMRKSGRVLATISDALTEGRAQGILSTAGEMTTWFGKVTKNLSGVIDTTLISLDKKRRNDWKGRAGWKKDAIEGKSGIWGSIALPEWAQQTAEAAELYRSQIIDMAYMAARMAEPSNRGLSDKDIQNALLRIAGDSANPKVIMSRFIEHVIDGQTSVQRSISSFYGMDDRISNEQVDRFLGGEGLVALRRETTEFEDLFNFSTDRFGRVTFDAGSIGEAAGLLPSPLPIDNSIDNTADLLPGGEEVTFTDVEEFFEGEF